MNVFCDMENIKIIYTSIFLCLIFINCQQNQQTPTKVLFIGNSLTYYHEMPSLLQAMLDESADNYEIEQSTYAGYTLKGHLDHIIIGEHQDGVYTRQKEEGETTATIKKLEANNYDYIILQEQTGGAAIPEMREIFLTKTLARYEDLIDTNKTKIILFQNFPIQKNYPRKYCKSIDDKKYCSELFNNLEEEMAVIRRGFEGSKKDVVKVGEAYYEVIKNHPEINLYSDESHPSKEGAFLSALVFYQYFTKGKTTQLKYIANLNVKDADILKRVVEK